MVNARAGLRSSFLAVRAMTELAMPVRCAGCARPGAPWCALCRAAVAQLPKAGRAGPTPVPIGFPRTWASAPFEGAVRRAIVAYKDEGRRDLAAVLAPLLREAVVGAVGATRGTAAHGLWLVAVPSSSKARVRRGDAPLEALARRAASGVDGLVLAPWALALGRGVADQARLDHRARAANLSRAMCADPASAGRTVVLVDDVVTTGATLVEAARALRDAGCSDVVAACVAATRRRTTHHRDGVDRAGERRTGGIGRRVLPPVRG